MVATGADIINAVEGPWLTESALDDLLNDQKILRYELREHSVEVTLIAFVRATKNPLWYLIGGVLLDADQGFMFHGGESYLIPRQAIPIRKFLSGLSFCYCQGCRYKIVTQAFTEDVHRDSRDVSILKSYTKGFLEERNNGPSNN